MIAYRATRAVCERFAMHMHETVLYNQRVCDRAGQGAAPRYVVGRRRWAIACPLSCTPANAPTPVPGNMRVGRA